MEIPVNLSVSASKEIINSYLLTDDEEGEYLLSMHTGSFKPQLMIKLCKLGYFRAIENEEVIVQSDHVSNSRPISKDRSLEILTVGIIAHNTVEDSMNISSLFSNNEKEVMCTIQLRTRNNEGKLDIF